MTLPGLLTIHWGRNRNGPGRSSIGMTQHKGELLQARAKTMSVHLPYHITNSPVDTIGEVLVLDDDVMGRPAC